jgi:catechol 2,3-dioxygenase-like lactoylglutathione lyase family enzyme
MTNRPYGPINQNAFIVTDIDAAIDYWTRVMRVGPFFKFPKIEFAAGDYRGKPFKADFNAAIAYSGDLIIELIKPNGPSIFQEFLDAGGKGVQHLAAFTDDMTAACAAVEKSGGKRVQGGSFADGSAIAYFDMGGPAPSILEIACLKAGPQGLFAAIKAAGAAWDGVTKTISFG